MPAADVPGGHSRRQRSKPRSDPVPTTKAGWKRRQVSGQESELGGQVAFHPGVGQLVHCATQSLKRSFGATVSVSASGSPADLR